MKDSLWTGAAPVTSWARAPAIGGAGKPPLLGGEADGKQYIFPCLFNLDFGRIRPHRRHSAIAVRLVFDLGFGGGGFFDRPSSESMITFFANLEVFFGCVRFSWFRSFIPISERGAFEPATNIPQIWQCHTVLVFIREQM